MFQAGDDDYDDYDDNDDDQYRYLDDPHNIPAGLSAIQETKLHAAEGGMSVSCIRFCIY